MQGDPNAGQGRLNLGWAEVLGAVLIHMSQRCDCLFPRYDILSAKTCISSLSTSFYSETIISLFIFFFSGMLYSQNITLRWCKPALSQKKLLFPTWLWKQWKSRIRISSAKLPRLHLSHLSGKSLTLECNLLGTIHTWAHKRVCVRCTQRDIFVYAHRNLFLWVYFCVSAYTHIFLQWERKRLSTCKKITWFS